MWICQKTDLARRYDSMRSASKRRLGRSGSTELAEVLALPGASLSQIILDAAAMRMLVSRCGNTLY
jgi:hypothetical protein